jgi:hypothetical protein
VLFFHMKNAKWNQPEKLIRSDIKTYYAYFPAYFIEKDIRLNFLDDKNYEHKTFFHRDDKTKDGNRIIITSNGMTKTNCSLLNSIHIIQTKWFF